jgi:hypothetical protein
VTELAQDQQALIEALQAKLDAANAKIAQQAGGLVAGEKDGFEDRPRKIPKGI